MIKKVNVFINFTRLYSEKSNKNLLNLIKNMPYEGKKLSSENNEQPIIRKNRLSYKEYSKFPAAIASLQVLGSGSRGCPQSIALFTNQISYLFNCGEGSQRLASEQRKKLSKIEHIFITNSTWVNIGGLLGLALTIQDAGVTKLVLHGPKNLMNLFSFAGKLFYFNNLEIEIDSEMEFKDSVMEVKAVQIPNTNCYSYICKLLPKPGTLCLEKCLEAGVPVGPLLGRLKSGQDVTLENGNVVKACDVLLPEINGPIFLMIDCSSESVIDDFVQLDIFKNYQKFTKNDENAAYTVIHFSPKEVVENVKYKEWMNLFPLSTIHLNLNEMNVCPGYISAHIIQYKLNLINSKIFPLLKTHGICSNDSTKKQKLDSDQLNTDSSVKLTNGHSSNKNNYDYLLLKAHATDTIHLRPLEGFDISNRAMLDVDKCLDEVFSIENFTTTLNEYKEKCATDISNDDKNLNNSSDEKGPVILFTGTGSCIPNKTRNTSGILWFVNDNNLILMDCGEGTTGQLVRFFGCDEINSILIRIKAIYISHMHADHYLGLIGLLLERKRAFIEENLAIESVVIFGPSQLDLWLNRYSKYFEDLSNLYSFFLNNDFIFQKHNLLKSEEDKLLNSIDLKEINTTVVQHCANPFGVTFVDKNNFKLTYSGDTMPCDQLVQIGYGSDLLIHEATMEDDLINEARIKYHSTFSEAINQGQKMKAKQILLTHFSQRYAKVPLLGDNFNNVAIAFDNMIADLNDLKKMPWMYPALHNLFIDYQEELELRAIKKRTKEKFSDRFI